MKRITDTNISTRGLAGTPTQTGSTEKTTGMTKTSTNKQNIFKQTIVFTNGELYMPPAIDCKAYGWLFARFVFVDEEQSAELWKQSDLKHIRPHSWNTRTNSYLCKNISVYLKLWRLLYLIGKFKMFFTTLLSCIYFCFTFKMYFIYIYKYCVILHLSQTFNLKWWKSIIKTLFLVLTTLLICS